jgi:hypothetical protein
MRDRFGVRGGQLKADVAAATTQVDPALFSQAQQIPLDANAIATRRPEKGCIHHSEICCGTLS